MISLISLAQIFTGGLLLFTVTLAGKPRLPAMIRHYAISSFFLAGLSILVSFLRHDPHAYVVAAGTVLFKGIIIPWVLLTAAKRFHASMQLKFIVRPGGTYLVFAALFATTFFITRSLSFPADIAILSQGAFSGTQAMFVCIFLLLSGLSLMILRRDIYSQIIGFMVMENGVVAYGVLAVGGLPVLMEIGVLLAVTAGTLLMAVLSHQVQETYATGDTALLTELTD